MKDSRFSDEQIIAMLKENEAGAKVDVSVRSRASRKRTSVRTAPADGTEAQ